MGFFDKWKEKWFNKKEKNEEEQEQENLSQEEVDVPIEEEKTYQDELENQEENSFSEIKNDDVSQETIEKEIEKSDLKDETSSNALEERKEVEKKEETNASNEEEKEVKIYEKGLTKSRKSFISKLQDLTNKYKKIEDAYFDELEEILIMADIGVDTVMRFIDKLKARVREEKIDSPFDLKEVIVDELFIIYVSGEVLSSKIEYNKEGPTILLFVGVNGVGKTTTIAKLAYRMKKEGKKVLLVAGDTFRAGATMQLKNWSEKIGVDFYGKEEGVDPASVVFDGVTLGKEKQYDVVLIDTAGRLQNKDYLMRELEKINRVIKSITSQEPNETLLVLDATTGQNGISQAKNFQEIVKLTGIVLTKLDGTAKGGIVLAIKEEIGLPVKYIGLGEREEDLQVFDIEKYIYGLFKDFIEENENE